MSPHSSDRCAAIKLQTNSIPAYIERARAYEDRGTPKAALRDFNKVLDIDPDHRQALLGRARLLRKEGSVDDSIAELNAVQSCNDCSKYAEKGALVVVFQKKFPKEKTLVPSFLRYHPNYGNGW